MQFNNNPDYNQVLPAHHPGYRYEDYVGGILTLTKAAILIPTKEDWVQKGAALDSQGYVTTYYAADACQLCLTSAIYRSTHKEVFRQPAFIGLAKVINNKYAERTVGNLAIVENERQMRISDIIYFNDNRQTKHDEVLQVIEEAKDVLRDFMSYY